MNFNINKHEIDISCKGKEGEYKDNTENFQNKWEDETQDIVLTQENLTKLAISEDPLDRIKAIKNGYESSKFARDINAKVRLEAARAGMCCEQLVLDENEEVSREASKHYYSKSLNKLYNLHNELVPEVGKSKNKAGEIVRAMSRLNYRYFNNDEIVGYRKGNDTCNSSLRYLIEEFSQLTEGKFISNDLQRLWESSFIPRKEYEGILKKASLDIANYIKDYPELKLLENELDSRFDFQDTEETTYEIKEDSTIYEGGL